MIDILLATYNGELYIDEQLKSIYDQSFSNWRIIIHDDNSTDKTVEIIKRHVADRPEQISYIEDDICTGSAKDNFNLLLAHSTSDYTMFCDQDDFWLPNKIELTYNKMMEIETQNNNTPLLVYTDLSVTDSKLNIVTESMWKVQNILPETVSTKGLFFENYITGCTIMINAATRKLVKTIPQEALIHDWWIALIVSITGSIAYVNKPTILYRQHGLNDTGAKNYSLLAVALLLFKKPFSVFSHLNSLSSRIYIRNQKLFDVINNLQIDSLNENFDSLTRLQSKSSIIARKIVMIQEQMLMGNILKKIAKVIFYT